MAKGSFFSRSKNNWGFQKWKTNCPEFTFKVLTKDHFPDFLPKPLSEKFISGYLASSGTIGDYEGELTHFYIGMFVGLRPDKTNLDEQQYVSVYNRKSGAFLFDGYLQHPEYEGRTTTLTFEQIQIINSSCLTQGIKSNRLPDISIGHLSYLAENNIITGLEVSAMKAMEEL